MTTDRSHILAQLAEGQISADQAAEFLRGAGEPAAPGGPARLDARAMANRWLRVRVSDLTTGRQKVSVNLPLAWVAVGLKIGARYSPEVGGLDLNEILAEIQKGASGRLVEVEDLEDGERVEVYVD